MFVAYQRLLEVDVMLVTICLANLCVDVREDLGNRQLCGNLRRPCAHAHNARELPLGTGPLPVFRSTAQHAEDFGFETFVLSILEYTLYI